MMRGCIVVGQDCTSGLLLERSDPARPLRAQQPRLVEEVETESGQRMEVVKILDHRYERSNGSK
jgi:hypothetical protein